jgi:hypothetical protein
VKSVAQGLQLKKEGGTEKDTSENYLQGRNTDAQ